MNSTNDFVIKKGVLKKYAGTGGAVVIPEGVTSIGSKAFSKCRDLKSVTIPEGVTSIGNDAFYKCGKLTSVTIPDSVTSIGDEAFYECSSLTNVTIPGSVTSIGERAFEGCSSLTSVTAPESVTSIGDSAIYGRSSLADDTIFEGSTGVGDYAFYRCDGLTSVTIPDSVTNIGRNAFSGCSSLTGITIPNSVTSIGDHAFYGCSSLTNVTIPESVTYIGINIFRGCKGLTDSNGLIIIRNILLDYSGACTDVVIPEGVTVIGGGAFAGCRSITAIAIPDSVTSIGNLAFSVCSSLTCVAIPEGVTSIGKGTFNNCCDLTRIIIPDSVTSIGDGAFSNCKALTSVTIPDSLTNIGRNAFSGCSSLTGITIPNSVTSIGDGAFSDCKALTSVTIPDSLTAIGRSAFSGCSNLTSVTIPDSVTSIGDEAFYECSSLTNVTIPESVTSIGNGAFYSCSRLTGLAIPKSVTSIGLWAFSGCGSLTNVTIPESVTSISDRAFSGCSSLISVTIPESVTSIGDSAFSGCGSLTNVTIPEGVTSIGDHAFDGTRIKASAPKGAGNVSNRRVNSSAAPVTVNGITIAGGKLLKYSGSDVDIVIPDIVTSIGRKAFSYCSPASVTIPESVKSINREAFSGCSSLTGITIPKSVKSIGDGAFSGCSNLARFTLLNPNYEFNNDLFGSEMPEGLSIYVEEWLPRFTDSALKKYVLSPTIWPKLSYDLQAEIFITRQGKAFTPFYEKCVDDADPLGKGILERLSGKPGAKVCNAAAIFMTALSTKASEEILQQLYEALKPIKAASRALTTIESDDLLMAKLNSGAEAPEQIYEAARAVMRILEEEHKSVISLVNTLKMFYGEQASSLPEVNCTDGSPAPKPLLPYLLTAHERMESINVVADYSKPGICEHAAELVSFLDQANFQDVLRTLANENLGIIGNSKRRFMAYPICRYADEELMTELTRRAPNWTSSVSGKNAPPLYTFRMAALYSETSAAMLFAEKYGDLDKYASIRGTDADTIRDRLLSDVGLDEAGGKIYDLGNQTVTARLQQDLSFLVELPGGKTAKSLPKKGADPEKYAAANADFSKMKKDTRKIVKSRSRVLFDDFLSGRARPADEWKKGYLGNPILRHVGSLLVWAQGRKTFLLTSDGAVASDGTAYTIGDGKIALAHPMNMSRSDLTAWQKYFAAKGIKQPFEQIWEPVVDLKSVEEDRYRGCLIPYYRFSGQEKHGIHVKDEDFHGKIDISFDDCNAEAERIEGGRHSLEISDCFEIYSFSVKRFSRMSNHIVAYLDRATIYERIRRNDTDIAPLLPQFTLAQITEFLKVATENHCTNVTALLLDFKNRNFADFDPMEEFSLDL